MCCKHLHLTTLLVNPPCVGENEHQQLLCMMEILGLPPRYLAQAAPRANVFFDAALQPLVVPNGRGTCRYPGSTDLCTAVGCNDPALLSFLQACLVWDAGARLTVEQALQHPFITQQPMQQQGGRRGTGGRAPQQVQRGHKAKQLGASTVCVGFLVWMWVCGGWWWYMGAHVKRGVCWGGRMLWVACMLQCMCPCKATHPQPIFTPNPHTPPSRITTSVASQARGLPKHLCLVEGIQQEGMGCCRHRTQRCR